MKKRKMRFNPDKAFRNLVILANIITIGLFIYKIATCGIGGKLIWKYTGM